MGSPLHIHVRQCGAADKKQNSQQGDIAIGKMGRASAAQDLGVDPEGVRRPGRFFLFQFFQRFEKGTQKRTSLPKKRYSELI
jgi:hypothetical protein